MYTDAENRPSNVQEVIGNGATVLSTDAIDLQSADRDMGRGFPVRAYVNVETSYVGGTSIVAKLIESATSNLASETVLATGPVTTVANAIAGAILLDVVVPKTSKRYLGFQYITVGNVTAGNVSAHVLGDTDRSSAGIPANTGR